MARKLIATVVGTLGTVKVYRDAEWNEYRVVTAGGSTYHTDDKQDAMYTARYAASAGKEVTK